MSRRANYDAPISQTSTCIWTQSDFRSRADYSKNQVPLNRIKSVKKRRLGNEIDIRREEGLIGAATRKCKRTNVCAFIKNDYSRFGMKY